MACAKAHLDDVRWEAQIHRTDTCWLWVGAKFQKGYGRYGRASKRGTALAHRVAYERWVGPIPSGLTIDHLCNNKACVNPAHLEPVTLRENRRRAALRSGHVLRKLAAPEHSDLRRLA